MSDKTIPVIVGMMIGLFIGGGIGVFVFYSDASDGIINFGEPTGLFVRVDSEQEGQLAESQLLNNDLKTELKLVGGNLDYCKNALFTERSVARELWDDYWNCLLPIWCEDDIEYCLEEYPEVTKENLEYMSLLCYYSENYNKYFERYE